MVNANINQRREFWKYSFKTDLVWGEISLHLPLEVDLMPEYSYVVFDWILIWNHCWFNYNLSVLQGAELVLRLIRYR